MAGSEARLTRKEQRLTQVGWGDEHVFDTEHYTVVSALLLLDNLDAAFPKRVDTDIAMTLPCCNTQPLRRTP